MQDCYTKCSSIVSVHSSMNGCSSFINTFTDQNLAPARTGPDIVKRETTFCTLPRAYRTKPFVVLILFDSVEHSLDSPKHHQLQRRNYRSMSHLFEKNIRSRDLQGCRGKARSVTVVISLYIYYFTHFYCIYIWVDVNGGHGGRTVCVIVNFDVMWKK